MPKRKKFTEPGQVETKKVWNKAKTRKWEMTYKLIDVKAPKKTKKNSSTKKPKSKAIRRAKSIIAKATKSTPKKKPTKRKKARAKE